jgi:hypothetical protein
VTRGNVNELAGLFVLHAAPGLFVLRTLLGVKTFFTLLKSTRAQLDDSGNTSCPIDTVVEPR